MFVKCVWGVNGFLRSFVFLYLIDCIVCGIDCCVRAMSPKGAILLHSPGRKPWVNHWNTFIEPLQGRHFLTQGCVWSLCCIYSVGHLLAWVSAALSGLFVGLAVCTQGSISGFALISPWALQEYRPFRALCRIGCVSPGFHIGLRLISPWAMQECRVCDTHNVPEC